MSSFIHSLCVLLYSYTKMASHSVLTIIELNCKYNNATSTSNEQSVCEQQKRSFKFQMYNKQIDSKIIFKIYFNSNSKSLKGFRQHH